MDHAKLSVECYNQVADWIYAEDRNPEDNILMRETAHASLYHWLQREDCKPLNLSIGLWQVSRVHSILGEGETAMQYAKECIEVSESNSLPPFFIGYGYEAAARAAKTLGGRDLCSRYIRKIEQQLAEVKEAEDRKYLEDDLADLKGECLNIPKSSARWG